MSDLINSALYEAWKGSSYIDPLSAPLPIDERWKQVIRQIIEAVQSERKTGQWIPCSERLPNEDTIIYNGVGKDGERTISDRVLAVDLNGFIMTGYFIKSCRRHIYHGNGVTNEYSCSGVAQWEFGEHYLNNPDNWICGNGFDAVAWKPLPEPFKEESNND